MRVDVVAAFIKRLNNISKTIKVLGERLNANDGNFSKIDDCIAKLDEKIQEDKTKAVYEYVDKATSKLAEVMTDRIPKDKTPEINKSIFALSGRLKQLEAKPEPKPQIIEKIIQAAEPINGEDGDSAYAIWLKNGNQGSEIDFLTSLQGENGKGIERIFVNAQNDLVIIWGDGKRFEYDLDKLIQKVQVSGGGGGYSQAQITRMINSVIGTNFVPYTGAIQNVDLGNNGLTANNITSDSLAIGSLSGILKATAGVVSGGAAINDLSDVTESSPSTNQVLKFDGVNLDYRNGFVAESEITFTDIADNNASTSAHGYLPKLSGSSVQYLDGTGAYSTPSGIVNSYTSQAFSAQTSVTVTHNFGVFPIVQVLDASGFVRIPLNIEHTNINAFTVTFSSSSSGTIIASVGSAGLPKVVTTAIDYTTLAVDKYVRATASGITITLVSSPSIGFEQEVKNDSSGSITVASPDNIDGSAAVIVSPSDNLAMYYNGTEWTIR